MFGGGENEGKVLRKALRIAFHRLVEAPGGDSVNVREVGVEHHPLLANVRMEIAAGALALEGGFDFIAVATYPM